MKKILCSLLCIGYLFTNAQQRDSATERRSKIDLLIKQCDSARTMPGSIMVVAIGKAFEKISGVNIKAYSRGQVVMDAETDMNGFCNFEVSDPSKIDSIAGYKGKAYFKCTNTRDIGESRPSYILQARHYTETGDKKK